MAHRPLPQVGAQLRPPRLWAKCGWVGVCSNLPINPRWQLIGDTHGSPSDPLKLAMLQESLEPLGVPFCHLSGNPVEGTKFYRGRRLGEDRFRDSYCTEPNQPPRFELDLIPVAPRQPEEQKMR